jgi:hypothetical protein
MTREIYPPLPHDVYLALKTWIGHHGVEQPTIWDDLGNILDGCARETACAELGVTCLHEVRQPCEESERGGI